MSFLIGKIEWSGNGGDSEAVEITDWISMNIRQTAKSKASGAEITLQNPIDYIKPDASLKRRWVGDDGLTLFREGDTVKIYLAYTDTTRAIDTSDGSDDLIMTAEISEFKVKINENKTTIKIKCVDKTYTLLNKLWAFNYNTTSALTAPEIIQDVIRNVTDDAASEPTAFNATGTQVAGGIYTVDARLNTGAYPGDPGSPPAYIQDRRPPSFTGGADSAFPVTTIAKTFKSAYEFIQELSTPEHTNLPGELDSGNPPADRNYIFYIDHDNRFHWFYPQSSLRTTLNGAHNDVVATITVASTTGFKSRGILQINGELIEYTATTPTTFTGATRGFNNTTAASHTSGDTVSNSLTFVEGDTTSDNIIYSMDITKKTFDIVNMVIFNAGQDLFGSGVLNYFYDRNTGSKELKMTYKPYTQIAKEWIQKEIDDGRLTETALATAPFTFKGNRYDETTGTYAGGAGVTTAWGTTVTSDALYNTAVRNQCIAKGEDRASLLTKARGSPRWKGKIEVKGKRFIAGDLITLNSVSAGIVDTDVLIKEIKHNVKKSGWFTTLNIEEQERARE
jgi:hypothetical protein|tara:strand:- start:9666 stop:11354 length:1689 start_codon:yes stop_codon:yes gene_type:complete